MESKKIGKEERNSRKIMEGEVIGNKADKTVVVIQLRTIKLSPYGKLKSNYKKKYQVHDPENRCKIGDKIKMIQTRPLSKQKRWAVLEILNTSYIEQEENKNL